MRNNVIDVIHSSLPKTLKRHPVMSRLALAGMIAIVFVTLSFLLEGTFDFNVWDEGFLWYGSQRVLRGEVPIRDFQSYDPGRYYWAAIIMSVLRDDGILPQRIALHVCQVLAITTLNYTLLVDRSKLVLRDVLGLSLINLLIHVWLKPIYATFDMSVSICSISVLGYCSRKFEWKSALRVGCYFGFLVFLGRNHAVYFLFGWLLILLSQRPWTDTSASLVKIVAGTGLGVVIGLLPMIFLSLRHDGFLMAYIESMSELVRRQSTNLPLPIPYPWTIDYVSLGIRGGIQSTVYSLFFMTVFGLGIVSVPIIVFLKRMGNQNALFIGATALALPYAHYVHSRADIDHLARGIFPLIVLAISVTFSLSIKRQVTVLILAIVSSSWVMSYFHGIIDCSLRLACKPVMIGKQKMFASKSSAEEIELLSKLVTIYSKKQRNFAVFPFMCSAYPMYKLRSPLHDIYLLYPCNEHRQVEEIARFSNQRFSFVLISDIDLDGKKELSFASTHNLLNEYISGHYDRVYREDLPLGYRLYIPKKDNQTRQP
jgi:hypothetical protein